MIATLALVLAAAAPATPRHPLPADVRALLTRWKGCTHWGGEGPSDDPARQRQIDEALTRLRCATLEADSDRLKRRYVRDPNISRRIDRAAEGDAP